MQKIEWVKEITATIMVQTYNTILLHAQRLELTVGEVIDRAFIGIAIPDARATAQFAFDQFNMTIDKLSDVETAAAYLQLIALLCEPFLRSGLSVMELMEMILECLGEDLNSF